jgi:hypothetical protein
MSIRRRLYKLINKTLPAAVELTNAEQRKILHSWSNKSPSSAALQQLRKDATGQWMVLFKKCPQFIGTIYRGLALTPMELNKLKRTTIKFNLHSSASKSKANAATYGYYAAAQYRQDYPKQPAKLAILLTIHVNKPGVADISEFEEANNREVVIIKNTKFHPIKIIPMSFARTGVPTVDVARHGYNIIMEQMG